MTNKINKAAPQTMLLHSLDVLVLFLNSPIVGIYLMKFFGDKESAIKPGNHLYAAVTEYAKCSDSLINAIGLLMFGALSLLVARIDSADAAWNSGIARTAAALAGVIVAGRYYFSFFA